MRHRAAKRALAVAALAAALALGTGAAHAQGGAAATDLGRGFRVDAAKLMVTLAVQQAVSILPPTAGQSLAYVFDPALDTYVRSELMEPASLRTPRTIGAGRVALRFSSSYLDLAEELRPAVYAIRAQGEEEAFAATAFGLDASARVGLFNFSATWGYSATTDFSINVPLSIVDAQASEVAPRSLVTQPFPAAVGDVALSELDRLENGMPVRLSPRQAVSRDLSTGRSSLGAVSFDELASRDLSTSFGSGTQVGLGRISLGAKTALVATDWLESAFALDVFLPSPSEGEFAGPDSAAFVPRLVARGAAAEWLAGFTSVGYDWDTQSEELRSFVWSAGAAVLLPSVTLDVGFSGAVFEKGIEYTPERLIGEATTPNGETLVAEGIRVESADLGTNLVDVQVGVKVALGGGFVLSGVANVPITDDGFRPDAAGTIAIESYF